MYFVSCLLCLSDGCLKFTLLILLYKILLQGTVLYYIKMGVEKFNKTSSPRPIGVKVITTLEVICCTLTSWFHACLGQPPRN